VCNIPFFNKFSREQVEGIMAASMVLRFKKTETIVSEGEVDDSLFIILSGKVDVLKRQKKIDSIEKGECFGEMAYLSGQPRDASIIASTDCVMLKVSATLMDKAAESVQLCFMRSFSQTLVHRLSKNNIRVWSLLNRVSKSGQK
jgi:serine/threonine-protein kinase